jgi:formylmethanofuran dehydrogenase subunit A
MTLLCVKSGVVYDPQNGIDGEVRDLWMQDGRMIPTPAAPGTRPDKTIDATGLIVMPGGVDMHCHIAGPKVNTARKMMPDEKRVAKPVMRTALTRSGTGGSVPSTFATGYLYAGLGYTTAFDAAIPPLTARHTHEEFHDTPIIDKGFYVLMGNNHYIMKQLAANEPQRIRNYIAWLLNATKGYACKLVNPGGVEIWKSTGGNAHGLDDQVDHFGVSPRQIITGVAQATCIVVNVVDGPPDGVPAPAGHDSPAVVIVTRPVPWALSEVVRRSEVTPPVCVLLPLRPPAP